MLYLAAVICFLLGAIHSTLGERFILIRLFRKTNLPKLFGSDAFTKGTLRFAWHITTFAFWGFAVLLWAIGAGAENLTQIALNTMGSVFALSAIIAFAFTRGKHLSWIALGVSALICFTAT